MDEQFMSEALAAAREARNAGNEPFGAILVKDGAVVMRAANNIFSNSDPTRHAELSLISDFCAANNIFDLSEYTLYTSCEPCVMCSGAMVWASLGKLVYSVSHAQLAEIAGSNIMISCEEVFAKSPHQPQVVGEVLNAEGLEIFAGYTFGE